VANFALTLVRGPGWDHTLGIREQRGWTEHAAFMDGLVADGFILVGGPVGDGQQTLHVVEARDEKEVRRRMAEDPWAKAGLLEIGAIQPWAALARLPRGDDHRLTNSADVAPVLHA
jgi:uncharacterized protein YciI